MTKTEKTNDTSPTSDQTPDSQGASPQDPVWTFRGYQMRPSEFNTAMVHYYRAEIQRSNVWRTRLDTTTNWAVVTTSAAISFALSTPTNHHVAIVLNVLLVTLFLWIEARRYRYYELWSLRTRLMETDFFAAMLVPPFAPSPEWAEHLTESLLQPDFPISMWEAIGRRLRRNYTWIFIILGMTWSLKMYLHPTPVASLTEIVARSTIGPIPGRTVLAAGVIYYSTLLAIGIFTVGLNQTSGEVVPKWGDVLPALNTLRRSRIYGAENSGENTAARRPGRKRRQLLAFIISTKPQAIADQVLERMRRGVTALHGRGMYGQQEREILMIALTLTEVQHLKSIVKAIDRNAFLVINSAQEVIGRGFQPLER
ncbi:MAG: DUF2270 domain-containing protein [Chloroflexota bacterium]|nr:DUF2270 domain-containing protein [Chloroflexota bacterium]